MKREEGHFYHSVVINGPNPGTFLNLVFIKTGQPWNKNIPNSTALHLFDINNSVILHLSRFTSTD